jgi:hypothetical protein
MSEFAGGKFKVRCVDCTCLRGNKCTTKRSKVSIKKRRICTEYNFKGEFDNRDPSAAVYLPHVDAKTRKTLKKLMKMGVLSNSSNSPIPPPAPVEAMTPYAPTSPDFKSTATAQIPVLGPLQSPTGKVGDGVEDMSDIDTVIWTPEDGESEEK